VRALRFRLWLLLAMVFVAASCRGTRPDCGAGTRWDGDRCSPDDAVARYGRCLESTATRQSDNDVGAEMRQHLRAAGGEAQNVVDLRDKISRRIEPTENQDVLQQIVADCYRLATAQPPAATPPSTRPDETRPQDRRTVATATAPLVATPATTPAVAQPAPAAPAAPAAATSPSSSTPPASPPPSAETSGPSPSSSPPPTEPVAAAPRPAPTRPPATAAAPTAPAVQPPEVEVRRSAWCYDTRTQWDSTSHRHTSEVCFKRRGQCRRHRALDEHAEQTRCHEEPDPAFMAGRWVYYRARNLERPGWRSPRFLPTRDRCEAERAGDDSPTRTATCFPKP